jgi:hypothetical protein
MASGYRQLKTTVAQTAANDAASIVAALVGAGGDDFDVHATFEEVFDTVFAKLSPIVDEDNKTLVAAEGEASATPKAKGRAAKTGGGSRAKSNGKAPSVEDALAFRLNWGAFGNAGEPGLSFAEILELSAEEAEADYGYSDGTKDGTDYVAWAASELNNNDTIRKNAIVVAAAEGITPLEPRS